MRMDSRDIQSWREWLASFGNGPNWSDTTGASVPIHKESFAVILDEHERLRKVLKEARDNVIGWDDTTSITLARANLAVMLDEALVHDFVHDR